MELSEIEKTWQEFGKRLEDNTRINKQILREMMTRKPKKRLRLLQAESSVRVLVFLALCVMFIIRFDAAILSFRGLMLACVIVFGGLYTYFSSFQVVWFLNKIDFSMSMQEINSLFMRLEKTKLHLKTLNVWSYPICSILLGYLFITKIKVILEAGAEFILPIVVVGIGGMIFSIIRTRELRRQLQKLNDEFNELNDPT